MFITINHTQDWNRGAGYPWTVLQLRRSGVRSYLCYDNHVFAHYSSEQTGCTVASPGDLYQGYRQITFPVNIGTSWGRKISPVSFIFFSWFQFLTCRKPAWILGFVIFRKPPLWRKIPRKTEKSFNFNWLNFYSCACRRIETEIYWKTFHTFQFGKITGNPAATRSGGMVWTKWKLK